MIGEGRMQTKSEALSVASAKVRGPKHAKDVDLRARARTPGCSFGKFFLEI